MEERRMRQTYSEHSEIAKAHTRTHLKDINTELDQLIGWMGAAGYTEREVGLAITARGLLRNLLNTLVVVNEEAELGGSWSSPVLSRVAGERPSDIPLDNTGEDHERSASSFTTTNVFNKLRR
jgi:hypothetical protein